MQSSTGLIPFHTNNGRTIYFTHTKRYRANILKKNIGNETYLNISRIYKQMNLSMEISSVSISNKHISHIVRALDCDMICFMNPYTFEIEDVPHDFLCGMYHDKTWQEAINRVDKWGKYITIDRPKHEESVAIMRSFVDKCIPSGGLKEELTSTLKLRRPDKNFSRIVEKSDYRDKWAVYNRRQMMNHIRRKLHDHISEEASLPRAAIR
jgi:hypothetical protein